MDTLRNKIEKQLVRTEYTYHELGSIGKKHINPVILEQILYELIDQIERMDKDSTAGGMYREHLALKEDVDKLRDRIGLLEELICPYGKFGIDTNNLRQCDIECPINRWKAYVIVNDNMTDDTICSKQA